MALTRDGRLWCAGSNTFGQCGYDYDISLGSNSQQYPQFKSSQHILRPVGSLYSHINVITGKPRITAPDPTCCAPRDSLNIPDLPPVAGCACQSGSWLFDNKCVTCPFGGSLIRSIMTAGNHTIVQTSDDLWWSFGLNSGGQLLRFTENLGLSNANTEVELISRYIFGDSNQPFIDFDSGSTADDSFVQTYRDFCTPGNYSIDRRSPCERCQAGSFADKKGSMTQYLFSLDQSVNHPHSIRYNLVLLPQSVTLNCALCGAGNYSHTNSSHCLTCAPGAYSFGGASTCHKCPPGTYSKTRETANCTLCALGKSSIAGSTVCFECGLGKYAPVNGSESCLNCAIGKYTGQQGTVECYECSIYSFQNTSASSACFLCPVPKTTGRYAATSKAECQSLCPAGKYGDVLGESSASMRNCKPCPSGYYGYNDIIPSGL
jgi:hypothetical protein